MTNRAYSVHVVGYLKCRLWCGPLTRERFRKKHCHTPEGSTARQPELLLFPFASTMNPNPSPWHQLQLSPAHQPFAIRRVSKRILLGIDVRQLRGTLVVIASHFSPWEHSACAAVDEAGSRDLPLEIPSSSFKSPALFCCTTQALHRLPLAIREDQEADLNGMLCEVQITRCVYHAIC